MKKDEAYNQDFLCDTEPSSSLARDIAVTNDSQSFQSRFEDGLVVFTFGMQCPAGDPQTITFVDVRFVIHKRPLLELLESAGQTASNVASNTRRIPWSEWGPLHTRWFHVHDGPTESPSLTWGQRIVTIRPRYEDHDIGYPISVYNFNPAAVSAAASTSSGALVNSLDPFVLFEDDARMPSRFAFEDTVWSQLPYVKSESPFIFEGFGGAVMDGDRIVLIRVGFYAISLALCL